MSESADRAPTVFILARGDESVSFTPNADGRVLVVTKRAMPNFFHRRKIMPLKAARSLYASLVRKGFETW